MLRFFGKYSYGIYVLHMPGGNFYCHRIDALVRNHVHAKIAIHLAELALALGITVPLAMLSFTIYETPFLQLKRWFTNPTRPVRESAGEVRALPTEPAL